jgi:hypothetical protein
MPVSNPTLFAHLLGPTVTRDAVYNFSAGLGGGQGFINRYEYWEPLKWLHYGTRGNNGTLGGGGVDLASLNHYDPSTREYYFYAMTGNETYLTRANAYNVEYRNSILASSQYSVPGQWAYSYPKGIALHYAATGDEQSRLCVGGMATNANAGEFSNFGSARHIGKIWGPGGPGDMSESLDGRIWSRLHDANVFAHAIDAPSPAISGWSAGGDDFEATAIRFMGKILDARYPDGPWRTAESQLLVSGTDYTNAVYDPNVLLVRHFYNAVICNGFIAHEHFVGPDARIWPAIQAALEYCFTGSPYNIWREAVEGPYNVECVFEYLEASCGFPTDNPNVGTPELKPAGHPGAGGDLNGLWLPSACMLRHKATGDKTIWDTRAKQLLKGTQFAYYDGQPKQLNESYTPGFQAMWWLLNNAASNPKKMRGTW